MCRRLNTLIEICSSIACLHFLYGRKIKINVWSLLVVLIDLFVFEIIHFYEINQALVGLVYILFFVYSMIQFGYGFRKTLVGNALLVIVMGTLQLLAALPMLFVPEGMLAYEKTALVIHTAVLFFLILLRKFLGQLFVFAVGKSWIMYLFVFGFGAVILYYIIQYRIHMEMLLDQLLILSIFGSLVCILAYCWQKEKELRYVKEMELQMHELYDASFRELISVIQEKQHDFHNHIQALQCQHYMIRTYEELVNEQEKYCEAIMEDNKFYRLLNINSPVLTGFLYGKFAEADRQGIEIQYSVQHSRETSWIPEYILVEILGILLDNAIENVLFTGQKTISVSLQETEKALVIDIGNPIDDISYEEIAQFFSKGKSSLSLIHI